MSIFDLQKVSFLKVISVAFLEIVISRIFLRCHKKDFDHADLLLTLIRLIDRICLKMETGNKPEETAAIINSVEAGILDVSEIGIAEMEIGLEAAQDKFKSSM